MEEWRDIKGREGCYQVSNTGRVRSLDRIGKNSEKSYMLYKGTILKPSIDGKNKRGYYQVNLWKNHQQKKKKVHILVLEAFVGKKPKHNYWARHLDGNRFNNRLSNLVWDTPTNNHSDKILHGTLRWGETHYKSKLTKRKVLELRSLKKTGNYSYTQLGEIFNVDRMTCYDAVVGRTWKHI